MALTFEDIKPRIENYYDIIKYNIIFYKNPESKELIIKLMFNGIFLSYWIGMFLFWI